MKNHIAPNNALLQSITPATKARVLESIYPNEKICYADEITHNLTRVKRILTGFSKLGMQEDEQITGELAMALSELLEQQIDISIALLHGSIYDHKEAA
jgi:type II secretory pathway component GspD/PulD (secretin)